MGGWGVGGWGVVMMVVGVVVVALIVMRWLGGMLGRGGSTGADGGGDSKNNILTLMK